MDMEQQSVAAVASASLPAVRVMERHGIDYCAHGERLFLDVCREAGLAPEDVATEMDASTAARIIEDERDWSAAPLRDLMAYLADVEHAFLRAELPLLEHRLQLVVEKYSPLHPEMRRLPGVFRALSTELEAHMQGEERELFPAITRYLDALDAGEPLKGSPLAAFGGPLHLMEQEHESAGAALRLLREFCQNYNVPREACLRYRALIQGLTEFEEVMARHMYLENTVLYPRAAALKAARRWQETSAPRS